MARPLTRRYALMLDQRGQIVRRCGRGVRCGARDCRVWGHPCWLPNDPWDKPSEYYCYAHMRDAGFCPGCGNFWAGIESFDFSHSGSCENCTSEWDNDFDEDLDEWDNDPRRDPWDDALSNCYSRDWGETCGGAGSEDCEFGCPIRRDYYRKQRVVSEH